jgi:predicted CXXCH cytochrome family protein
MASVKKTWVLLAIVLGAPWPVLAKVSGPCVNCHTMHNSQAGSPMAYTMSGATKTYTGVANKGLLTTNCVGCHQGVNSGGAVPYVLAATEPTYGATGTEGNTLAGGNFYWVSAGYNRAGHNVADFSGPDPEHGNTPPGGTALASQLTCAGTYGCHGSQAQEDPTLSILGSHHKNDMTAWQEGDSVATSYRFLDGVKGLEDSDYEYQPTSAAHNKYYGVDRLGEGDSSGTISSHCGRCHGDFHNGSGEISAGTFSNNVWLRHPTDYDMSNARSQGDTFSDSEYFYYNDYQDTGNPYSVISPVATADSSTTLNEAVYQQADDAIVMCLSCHRAHGSRYDGILRWDYKNWPGTGFNGCALCHTAKD